MAKFDLSFDPPLMNAAGTLGFAPYPYGPVDLQRLGAFVTNPISLGSRAPAQSRGIVEYPGGFLLHSGYPNLGLKSTLRRYKDRWAASPLPVIVHLIGREPKSIKEMVRRLEGLDGVMGLELGLPSEASAQEARTMTLAALGELPLLVRLPLDRALELATVVEAVVGGDQMVALSLGPPRGALPDGEGRLIAGRLYGPALFPHVLAVVGVLAQGKLPLIAGSGIYCRQDWQVILSAGAAAVQLDTILWRGGW